MSSTRVAKTLALSAAAALHGVAIWGFATDRTIEIEGSSGAVDTRIGSSFADMAAGTISEAVPPETIEELAPRDVTRSVSSPRDAEASPPEEIQTAVRPDPVLPSAQAPAESAQAPLEPVQGALLPVVQTQSATLQDPQALRPVRPDMADAIAPEDEAAPTVTRSLRPKRRSAEVEKRAEPPKKEPRTRKAQSQPRGNAARQATAGAETGKKKKKAVVAGTGASLQKATGNAAASNYPGKVMKKISRVPKPRVGKKGTSVVAFTIAPGGGLSALSLARSSGSAKLDQAALRVVRRAAPFPPPPAGARRNFSINIKGG